MANSATKNRGIGRILVRRYYPLINLLLLAGLVGVGIFQAIIANKQANIYQNQARIMDKQREIADKQWIAMQGQATTMKSQLDAMEADQRAWIKVVKAEPYVNQMTPMNGLFMGPNTIGNLPLHFVLQNVGRSPAFKVIVGVWPQFAETSDLVREEQSNCAAMGDNYPDTPMRAMNSDIIPVLFPGDQTPYDGRGLAISPEQVTKFSIGDPKTYGFWFYGCVYYRLAGSKAAHQTGFAYWVTRLVDAPIPGGKAQTGFIPWENVPPDKLLFNPMPLAAGPTN